MTRRTLCSRAIIAASAAGLADTAAFAASRRQSLRSAPGRAAGTAALIALWSALGISAFRDRTGHSRRTRFLASALGALQGPFLGVHIARRAATPRLAVGAVATGIAVAAAWRRSA